MRSGGNGRGLGDDLAHPEQRAAFEALHHRHDVGRGCQVGRDPDHGRAQVRRWGREDDQVGGVGERTRVGRRGDRRSAGPRPGVGPRSGRSPRIRAAVSGEWHRSVTGSARATSLARVVPQAPAPMTATRGPSISGSAGLPGADAPRAASPRGPPDFLRRGSLTDERSRNTSLIGVPSKPNVSRSRFSR